MPSLYDFEPAAESGVADQAGQGALAALQEGSENPSAENSSDSSSSSSSTSDPEQG